MGAKKLIADSRLAFLNQKYETALNLANQAIALEPENPDAYKCAGNAYMSLARYDEAIKNYSQAVKCDDANGNRYFELGFAQATADQAANAMNSFARAEELGCTPENLAQLYNVLGIICFDIGRYDDALVNLSKAEQLLGIDVDIMQRKAVIYGIKNDLRNGLHTANQIKMVAPSEYKGYQIAFGLLIQEKLLDTAERELQMAEKYAGPSVDYYMDRIALELEKYRRDSDRTHFTTALTLIDKSLKTLRPAVQEVIDSYLNAAEIHLQLEEADMTIACLNAARKPIDAYNNGFEVIEVRSETHELSDYDVEEMIAEDRARIEEDLGEYGLEELVQSVEPDEDGSREYLTEIPEELPEEEIAYRLDGQEVQHTPAHIDQINRLYIGAFTLKKDFEKVIEYSRKLQTSENLQYRYLGKYTEANAMKELGRAETVPKYEEIIKFFRNAMIKDPTDIMAVTFRIQACIDMGRYDEAEEMCDLLNEDAKQPLLQKIREAKGGGDVQ